MDQIYKGTEEDRMEPYYYSKMNKVQQAAYHAIRQGLLEISDSIQIPGMEAEELYNVFFRLRLDHPEIFWATGYKYRFYQDSPNLLFLPDYLFEKSKIREHQQAMRARIDKLIRPAKDLSESEKEQYIHDFICENVHYDKLKKPYSHEIIGPLGQGVGVCEGMAKTVKLLCDGLGLPCMIAVSDRDRANGERYLHAWNIVQLGGQTPLNLASELKANGVNIIGTSPESIDAAEDREIFKEILDKLHLKQPVNATAMNPEQAYELAGKIGFPILLRPSFVLGGRGMFIVYNLSLIHI